MAQRLSDLALGTKVKDINTTYYGVPIIWQIADKNHSGYPANSVTLITEKILTLKCFDAIEPSNIDPKRKIYGNNRYIYANIRRWLNSDAGAGAWYAAQHSTDAPPTAANCWDNHNPYDTQAGFLNAFSTSFRNALLTTTLIVARNVSIDGGGSETLTDKLFLASSTEVGVSNGDTIVEGAKLALFSEGVSRLAKPTTQAVSNSTYKDSNFNVNIPWFWWLRTPDRFYSYYVYGIPSDNGLISNHAYNSCLGVRPLCNLLSSILVSDTADSDGCYTLILTPLPVAPIFENFPTIIEWDKPFTVQWGQVIDTENRLIRYTLHRKNDEETTWNLIYEGAENSTEDVIPLGIYSAQYKLVAIASDGMVSTQTIKEFSIFIPKMDLQSYIKYCELTSHAKAIFPETDINYYYRDTFEKAIVLKLPTGHSYRKYNPDGTTEDVQDSITIPQRATAYIGIKVGESYLQPPIDFFKDFMNSVAVASIRNGLHHIIASNLDPLKIPVVSGEPLEKKIKTLDTATATIWEDLYTDYADFVIERLYSDSDQIESDGLLSSAYKEFIKCNKPTESYSTAIIDYSLIINDISEDGKLDGIVPEIGDTVNIYNDHLFTDKEDYVIKVIVFDCEEVKQLSINEDIFTISDDTEIVQPYKAKLIEKKYGNMRTYLGYSGVYELTFRMFDSKTIGEKVNYMFLNNFIKNNNPQTFKTTSINYDTIQLVSDKMTIKHTPQKSNSSVLSIYYCYPLRIESPIQLQISGVTRNLREKTLQLSVEQNQTINKLIDKLMLSVRK